MLTFPTSSPTKKYSIDSCKSILLTTFKSWASLTTQTSVVTPLQNWGENVDEHVDEHVDKNVDKNVGKTVGKTMGKVVGKIVGKTVGKDVGKDVDENLDENSENNLLKPATIHQKVLELLVYVVHREAAACLGDHILNLSRFSCQTGDTWVASITLRSWRVEEGKKVKRNKPSNKPAPNSSKGFLLPWNLRQVWGGKKGDGEKPKVGEDTIFKPQVSSVILSTNAFGDFSKCTVVSEFIGDEKMKPIVKDARKLWQKFIHQPQTARCLVFFLLLSEFCQAIAEHYKTAIDKLSSILKLDVGQYLIILYVIVRAN